MQLLNADRVQAAAISDPATQRVMAWLCRGYLVAGMLLTVVYFVVPTEPAKLVVWPIIGWSSVLAILVGVAVNRPEPRSAWYLLAAGVATLIVGDDLYSIRNFVQHADALFPSYIDIVYLAMYPLLVGGLALLVHRRSVGGDRSSVIDASIITAGLGLVSWVLLIAPYLHSGEFSVFYRLTSIAYPIGDVAVLAIAVRLAVGGGRRPGAFWLLTGGLVALLGADALYGYLNLSGTFSEHSPVDVGWIAFYVAWGAAALHPSMRGLSTATPGTEQISAGRVLVIGGAVLVPPAILFTQGALGNVTDPLAIALTGGLLIILVLVRIVSLVRESADRRSNARLQTLVDKTSDAIVVVDGQGRIQYHTPSTERMLGRHAAELDGTRLGDVLEAADGNRLDAMLVSHAAPATIEWRVRHTDGGWRDLDVIVDDLRGTADIDGIVFTMRDVTERKQFDLKLRRQTLHDSLTGLPNRMLFIDRIDQALRRGERRNGSVAVLVLDLDDFKMVNDSLGHAAGDDLLKAVTARLVTVTRSADSLARLGGDEFGFLLENGDVDDGSELAALRIQAALRAPFRVGDSEMQVHASIGIATGSLRTHTCDDVLRDADLAMYFAKRKGKDRFELFFPAMHENATRRLEVVADLLGGMDRGEFVVYYQPIVDTRNGHILGAEALVRWQHPRRGLVGPDEFIPVAETTGLIAPIDRWVLNDACRQTKIWKVNGLADDSFYISVNLSSQHLQDPSIAEHVSDALAVSGIAPDAVVLEVTETGLVDDVDSAGAALAGLKRLGVRIAVDDFGTGYSSLTHLIKFPIDILKIDKSFVDRVADGANGEVMVRAVVDLAHTLSLKAIAEGVEHPDQARALERLGCNVAQGYLFAPPVPAPDMTALLAQQSVSSDFLGPDIRADVEQSAISESQVLLSRP